MPRAERHRPGGPGRPARSGSARRTYPATARRSSSVAAGRERLVPWMWGVNGICGVIALVLGMLLAMYASYTTVLLAGAAAYGVTLLSLAFDAKPPAADAG